MADRSGRRLIGLDTTRVSARADRLVQRFHRTTASVTAAIRASMLDEPVHKGGEGVLLMNVAADGYWRESLFRLEGRGRQPLVPMLLYVGWCALATVANVYAGEAMSGEGSPFVIDTWVLAQLGTALFLLLVFRTEHAYERWWEGRRKWGDVIVFSRNLARQAGAYIDDTELAQRVIRLAIAYSAALKRHLRGERELTELAAVLSAEDIDGILASNHMTLHIACSISATIAAARAEGFINSIELIRLDESLTVLMDATGACERINSTKMPFAYIAHLRLFLAIWLLCLPFAMFEFLRWGAVPACAMTAYALVGLETTGVEIEGPFGHEFNDLPLDTYTDSVIKPNLLQILSYISPTVNVARGAADAARTPDAEATAAAAAAPVLAVPKVAVAPISPAVSPPAAPAAAAKPFPTAAASGRGARYMQMGADSPPGSPTPSPLRTRRSANDAMVAELTGPAARTRIGREGTMFRSSGSFVETFNLAPAGQKSKGGAGAGMQSAVAGEHAPRADESGRSSSTGRNKSSGHRERQANELRRVSSSTTMNGGPAAPVP
ncbi:hypothetical protein KFE25_009719 [Diacronema lutheri]|uniref:Bestrophin homolog n=1 Tax=Diacronema lutheri TaxID=2081491 RepID=A0A8J5XTB5_DIALT|nr:hypothetical protein KFE25_009719 [Diacronema lutheri]